MKTERLTLLVTPAEKALIGERAERLGVSASEFVRRAVELFDADDILALEELEALLPELNAIADRVEQRVERHRTEAAERNAERKYYRSDAYRTEVRRQLLEDETIDWDRARAVFELTGRERAA